MLCKLTNGTQHQIRIVEDVKSSESQENVKLQLSIKFFHSLGKLAIHLFAVVGADSSVRGI